MATTTMARPDASIRLLRLLYLASPTLPIGAYAYSQGLEAAVHAGCLTDVSKTAGWLRELLHEVLAYVDVPIFVRLYRAWERRDLVTIRNWSDELLAMRESSELQAEDSALGRALARLLRDLEVPMAAELLGRPGDPPATDPSSIQAPLAASFSLACVQWSIPVEEALHGYLYAWLENQIAAATRLIPLGQTESRRALLGLLDDVSRVVTKGLQRPDHDIGASAPGLAILSAAHETQYSRLFRS